MAMVKVGVKLSAIEDSKSVLYYGYRVAPIFTNGEKGDKRSGSWQLIAPDGARKIFLVADGRIYRVGEWNDRGVISEQS